MASLRCGAFEERSLTISTTAGSVPVAIFAVAAIAEMAPAAMTTADAMESPLFIGGDSPGPVVLCAP